VGEQAGESALEIGYDYPRSLMEASKLIVVLGIFVVGAAAVFACSDDGVPLTHGTDKVKTKADGGPDAQGPGVNNGPGSGPPPTPSLQIRVAALDDGAGAFDFCIGPSVLPDDGGTPVAATFQGPIMKGLGVAAGLVPGNVSQRVKVEPGSYLVRFVAADAANCDAAGGADPRLTEIFVPKQAGLTPTVTVTRIPVLNAEEMVPNHLLVDEAVAAGQANVRLYHAGIDIEGPIAVLSPAVMNGIFPGVTFGELATGSGFSPNGYRQLAPLANAQVTVVATDAEQTLVTAENVSLAAGKVYTLFTAGSAGNNAFRLLVCDDELPPANGLSPCMPFQMQQQ
jgi:hypothetical protein